MRKWSLAILASLLVLALTAGQAAAADPATPRLGVEIPNPVPLPNCCVIVDPTVNIAFSAIANRYSNVDPATVFDLNGDLVGDLQVGATTLTAKNGALIQLLNPAVLNLDLPQTLPTTGYSASAGTVLNRVYAMKLPGGGYAKFMILQASPKVTMWFNFGVPTSSVLTADGTGSHAVLNWTAMPEASLGYNIYRYEVTGNNSYTLTQLNDFTVQATTFTDETAKNRYYLYVVQAVKAGGSPGPTTTVAPVYVQAVQHQIELSPGNSIAKLDGNPLQIAAAPVIKNGLMMVPASLFTAAGVKVKWDGSTRSVALTRRIEGVTYTAVFTVDEPDYTWNGNTYQTDVLPYLADNVFMVPVRSVAPILGFGVTFDSATRVAALQWSE